MNKKNGCPRGKHVRWINLEKKWGVWVTAATHAGTFWFELDCREKASPFFNGDVIDQLENMTDSERIRCEVPHFTSKIGVTELVENQLMNQTFPLDDHLNTKKAAFGCPFPSGDEVQPISNELLGAALPCAHRHHCTRCRH